MLYVELNVGSMNSAGFVPDEHSIGVSRMAEFTATVVIMYSGAQNNTQMLANYYIPHTRSKFTVVQLPYFHDYI